MDEAEQRNQANKEVDKMKPFIFGILLGFSITSLPDVLKTIFPNGSLMVEVASLFIFIAFVTVLTVQMLPKVLDKFYLNAKHHGIKILWVYKAYILALILGLYAVIHFYI
ncbi:MAG: hypothetical protein HY364_04740 [Candidatus Aenigmarchaeota archaeon]|nr:hypothetical protein [Candidatus Aenigmarchaeota archaeon]